MTYDEFVVSIRGIIPEAQFETDNDGMVIIYTNREKSDFAEEGKRNGTQRQNGTL